MDNSTPELLLCISTNKKLICLCSRSTSIRISILLRIDTDLPRFPSAGSCPRGRRGARGYRYPYAAPASRRPVSPPPPARKKKRHNQPEPRSWIYAIVPENIRYRTPKIAKKHPKFQWRKVAKSVEKKNPPLYIGGKKFFQSRSSRGGLDVPPLLTTFNRVLSRKAYKK